LLDHDTYTWAEAQPGLDLCKRRSIPVILVSSKTRAEMNPLRLELGLTYPFVSENGGGVFFPAGSTPPPPAGAALSEGLWKLSLGAPYDLLVRSLREIRKELGLAIRGFSDMGLEEISSLTALDRQAARLAAMREYDEPFIVQDEGAGDIRSLRDRAEKRGLRVTAGGRFYHLHGNTDKGVAVERLVSWYRASLPHITTVGLGDSPNDIDMLRKVDHPFLVRSRQSYPGVEKDIPAIIVTEEKGPAGWNRAVSGILAGKTIGGLG
jgi:mannosyl-3-phosphoglycerate phosphatase